MKKLTVLVDADGVLENLSEEWVKCLNEKYGTCVRYEDLREWDMTKAFPTLTKEQVIEPEQSEELYGRLKPLKDAPEYLKRLIDDGHKVYVVTATPYKIIKAKIETVFRKYYPFLDWNSFIITSDKSMIRGDVLIDDGIHNLTCGEYKKLLFTAPYNRDHNAEENGMFRVDDWKQVYETVTEMAKEN